MKTKEFIDKVKTLGFEVRTEMNGKGKLVEIKIGDVTDYFAVIWPHVTYALSTIENGFTEFYDHLPLRKLYDLCFEYAKTPIEDREEEKKFYLEHKYLRSAGGNVQYFTIYIAHNFPFLKYQTFSSVFKQQFTLKEIEEIKKEFDTDLKDFELVEVEDEN